MRRSHHEMATLEATLDQSTSVFRFSNIVCAANGKEENDDDARTRLRNAIMTENVNNKFLEKFQREKVLHTFQTSEHTHTQHQPNDAGCHDVAAESFVALLYRLANNETGKCSVPISISSVPSPVSPPCFCTTTRKVCSTVAIRAQDQHQQMLQTSI